MPAQFVIKLVESIRRNKMAELQMIATLMRYAMHADNEQFGNFLKSLGSIEAHSRDEVYTKNAEALLAKYGKLEKSGGGGR